MEYMDNNKYKGHAKLASGVIYPRFFPIEKSDDVLNIGCGNGIQAAVYGGNFKSMLGVDISRQRLEMSRELLLDFGIDNFEYICADIENIPITKKFDKIIAIDIIEHVIHPEKAISEMRRLLKEKGDLLITFPAMHDKWENLFRYIARKLLRRPAKDAAKRTGWDPDMHQYDYSVKKWHSLMDQGGFRLIHSRATTMFPPLHYLGIPKFWFTNRLVNGIDSFFCGLPIIKNWGQSFLGWYRKKDI